MEAALLIVSLARNCAMSNAMAEREAEQAEAMYHRLARLVAGMVYGPEVLLANTPEGPLTEEEKTKHALGKSADEAAAAAEAEAAAAKAAAAKATGRQRLPPEPMQRRQRRPRRKHRSTPRRRATLAAA